ncbi:Zinc finger protein 8 [Spatholobus suberectus]|nr:Zinc finger protein 8 [Spatholobus suberectus]
MDNTERETHDFMNVDSFSQLPFLRPAPPSKEKAIRLFGQEFCDAPDSTNGNNVRASEHNTNKDDNNNNNNNTENGESSRRFECHYCCRNFPTSQALGGHQNAHKRERQHAKRHLHSAMAQTTISDADTYGFMNYRFGSAAMSYSYPTWNTNSSNAMVGNTGGGGRFHGSSYSQQLQPINGSPLGLSRIPTATTTSHAQSNPIFKRERSLHPLPLFAAEEMVNARMGPSRVGPSGSQNRFVYDPKPSVNDHVSLDLHL